MFQTVMHIVRINIGLPNKNICQHQNVNLVYWPIKQTEKKKSYQVHAISGLTKYKLIISIIFFILIFDDFELGNSY